MTGYYTGRGWKPPEPKAPDNPDCFLCGEPADERRSSLMYCHRHPEGPVRWNAHKWNIQPQPESTPYQGEILYFIDFTQADALVSPA